MQPENRLSGYLILDKPLGLSSAQAVGRVKRKLRELGVPLKGSQATKIGHGGTLDPLASGVLPLALGEATKTVGYVLNGSKAYDFTIAWGIETTTLDAEGAVTRTSTVRPTTDVIRVALPAFHGPVSQLPPAYSALKVDGQRAYALARAGEAVTLAPREIEIHALTLLACPDQDHAAFHVACGKGTYVRALARDLAAALGTVGHLSALRRTAAGPFTLAQAIPLETLERVADLAALQALLIPLQAALADLPVVSVSAAVAMQLRQGQHPACPQAAGVAPGTTLLITCEDQPVALCEWNGVTLSVLRGFNPNA